MGLCGPGSVAITWSIGTLRERSPADTWDAIQPTLRAAGCSRVADLTGLEPSLVPVHLAIRPAARSLTVAAGKGATSLLSKVSAAMEAIEFWQAEQLPPPTVDAVSARRLGPSVPYPVTLLDVSSPTLVHEDFPLAWVVGQGLASGAEIHLPQAYLSLDRVVRAGEWVPPLFRVSSNGLASGNTVDEAVLHALCEIIERDAVWANRGSMFERPVDQGAIADDTFQGLRGAISGAGGHLELYELPSRFGVPTLAAVVQDEMVPFRYGGSGTSPRAVIAACRALTEAIQQRAALIAGTRDDIPLDLYEKLRRRAFPKAPRPSAPARPLPGDLEVRSIPQLVGDITERILEVTGYEPVVFTYPPHDDAVAVVRVVAPGLTSTGRRGWSMSSATESPRGA